MSTAPALVTLPRGGAMGLPIVECDAESLIFINSLHMSIDRSSVMAN